MMQKRILATTAALLCLLAAASSLRADDLIQLSVTDTTINQSTTIGFKSIVDAVETLQKANLQQYLAGYAETDNFTSQIKIMGFVVNASAIGNSLTYSFTDADGNTVTRTFTGTTRDDAIEQFKDFFKSDAGEEEYEKLMQAMQNSSNGGFILSPDGTVGRTLTNTLANTLGETSTAAESAEAAKGAVPTSGFLIGAQYSSFTAGDFEGNSYTVPLGYWFDIGQRVKLTLDIPITYRDIEGSAFYDAGLELGLPIGIIGPEPDAKFKWVLTPRVATYGYFSEDTAVGGLLGSYGIANRLEYDFGRCRVAVGDFTGQYRSIPVSFGGIGVDAGVEETVTANGVKLGVRLFDDWVWDLYGMDTRAIDGYMSSYQTYGSGITCRAGKHYLRLGLATDVGDDYDSIRGELTGSFRF